MFDPVYEIGDVGFSGKHLWSFRFWKVLSIYCGEKQIMTSKPRDRWDLQYGGAEFGFSGRNYWIPNDCLIGQLITLIARKKK